MAKRGCEIGDTFEALNNAVFEKYLVEPKVLSEKERLLYLATYTTFDELTKRFSRWLIDRDLIEQQRLIDTVLSNHGTSSIRPYFNGPPLNVTCNIFINSFDSVKETTMEYSVTIYLHQRWWDPRLRHNSSNTITLYSHDFIDNIWRPDLYFDNEKKATFHHVTTDNRALSVSSDGEVFYSMRLSLTLSCNMNLRWFPMDKHKCKMVLLSYAYDASHLALYWRKVDPVAVYTDIKLPQFELTSYTTVEYLQDYGLTNWSFLEVHFTLERQMGFYILTTYIPSALLVILSWVSFWLHMNATAARVALGITTILTMATQITGARQSLPAVSYPTAIDVWMASCMFFVFAALLEFAAANYIYVFGKDTIDKAGRLAAMEQQKRKEELEMLQNFSLGRSRIDNGDLRSRDGIRVIFSKDMDDNDGKVHTVRKNIPAEATDNIDEQMRTACCSMNRAKYVDRGARIIFPVFFVAFNCVYWRVYLSQA
ncbi:glycine receptor subunit alpha-2-like [Saccoglossus kowalevskii]|uniref:Glycine receptor subunit alpha-1-like n=1 Tax=Saccoglossus kowalevskii TaxID=10224 RepID=A0ABM0GKD8_SACKO|nr:PREDICTED: glycine receptor subunit alpha-1-like [Saccoglossus kowalevskii]